jgi:DNA helicase-2/ATP-dependent DNA helicase PcrA
MRIPLNDFKRPAGLPTEKQRMIYMALSRPEICACIAVPNVFSEDQIIKVLGNQVEFI